MSRKPPISGLQGIEDKATVKTSSRGAVIAGFIWFALLFVGGGFWAYYTNLSGAVVASGSVVVSGKPKTVQHLDGGIVAEIDVATGDMVKKGQTLIRLDDKLLKANLNIYRNRLREVIARRARLSAERDKAEKIKWDEELLALLHIKQDPATRLGQQRLFEARKTTLAGQEAQLREKIAQYENQKTGIQALKASKLVQLGFIDSELKGTRSLKKKGLISRSQLMAQERQREELIGQIAEHDADLARIQNSIGETEIQILQTGREFRQSVLTELRQAEQDVNDMTQQLFATSEQLKRVTVKAPISGIVHELNVFTIGGVIAPGATIMQIIPQDGNFVVEANIQPQFIDELYQGQEAALHFSAFNQRTTPVIMGVVKVVSANVLTNQQTGQTYYVVKISVPKEQIDHLKGQKLVPGMPVEVFITTREQTVLHYFVKPLLDQVRHAFREE